MFLVAISLVAVAGALASVPEVTVSTGSLRGVLTEGGAVASFRDVPFATAIRFEAPKPAAAWKGVRDASRFGVGCAQGRSSHNPDVPKNQTEDCTRLNIFTPVSAVGAAPKLPVMVWWHGGGFKEGSSMGPFDLYDGSKMVHAHGVVIVSCNYRLGVFGALVHDGGITGNQGFLDQRSCLQWVKAEIGAFGGDPDSVTIWGQSAGAQSVFLHMASAGSAGLFHRAIFESSPDLSLFEAKDAARLGHEVAKKLNCDKKSDPETIACMRAADADALWSAADAAASYWLTDITTISLSHPTASFLPFKPNVDGIDFVEQPFATILSGNAPGAVPSIIGFNHDEMWALLDSFPSWFRGLEVQAALAILYGLPTAVRAWEHYSKAYPKHDDKDVSLKVLTDYIFTCSSQAMALKMPQAYVYQWNHHDSFGPTVWAKFGLAQCAHLACHETEIPLVFGNMGPAELNISFTPAERELSKVFMQSFTDLAKGRAPTGSSGAVWPLYDATNRSGLAINETAVPGSLGVAASVCADIWDKAGYLH